MDTCTQSLGDNIYSQIPGKSTQEHLYKLIYTKAHTVRVRFVIRGQLTVRTNAYVTLSGVGVDKCICGCQWVCVLKKDITGIKEHEAERHSKSRAGWMIMALACSLYIAHNALMLA